MQSGFLGVSVDPDFSDQVKIMTWDTLPEKKGENYEGGIQYITKFNDILAAKMQLHNALRHQLIDSNKDLYNATLTDTVAAIKSNNSLRQEQVWLNPLLGEHFLSSVKALTKKRKRKAARINRLIQLVGLLGLALLTMNFLSSLG